LHRSADRRSRRSGVRGANPSRASTIRGDEGSDLALLDLDEPLPEGFEPVLLVENSKASREEVERSERKPGHRECSVEYAAE
jgi:hypothetical protein